MVVELAIAIGTEGDAAGGKTADRPQFVEIYLYQLLN